MPTFMRCPECAKKGVTLRMTTSEDHYGCRYCDWYTFTSGSDAIDIQRRRALAEANPDLHLFRHEMDTP